MSSFLRDSFEAGFVDGIEKTAGTVGKIQRVWKARVAAMKAGKTKKAERLDDIYRTLIRKPAYARSANRNVSRFIRSRRV